MPHRRRSMFVRSIAVPSAMLAAWLLVVVGCSGGGTEASSTTRDGSTVGSDARERGTSVADGGDDEAPAGQLADQYGTRYCELLTVSVAEAGTTGEVWGTQGLNDCPQPAFDALDPEAIATELGVTVAVRNGPRFWVLDDIVANELAGSGERRSFGGLEMRSIATVDLGPGIPDRSAYTEISVARDTEFVFAAGRTIHELTGPDGSVYVMQSFSVEVDPALEIGDLGSLGERLALPAGWSFTSRTLEDDLVVEDVDGVATVIQDELKNSYQLRARG